MIRRKRNILEMAVATAIFGVCVAGAMPAAHAAQPASTTDDSAQAAPQTSDQEQENSKNKSQVANENELQPVVINGFVSSLQNSIVIQKNSDSIDEVVSAQEIGQLPGTSIADALGRLPGLAVQEFNGRPQQINIHGLSADFDVTDFNGNIQPSTSNNRDVELDQYPASWFDVIDVHMTPSADLVDQGIAGTIDMQTMRPLSQKGPVVHINAQYQFLEPGNVMPGPGSSNRGHEVDAIVADQFFDHTFGVSFGVDLDSNPTHLLHEQPWGYATDPNGNLIIGGSKNYNYSDVMNRNGYLATFEFKPSDAFTSTVDVTYEKNKNPEQSKGMEFPLAYGSNETVIPGTVVNGFDTSGTFENVYPVIRNDYSYFSDQVYNVLWRNDFKFADDWTANLNAGYSRAESDDVFLEAYSGLGYNGPNQSTVPGVNVAFSEGKNGELYLYPSAPLDGSNIMLTDPQGWGAGSNLAQAGFINAPHTEDYIGHVTLSATKFFESGPFSSLEFGVNRQRRRKDYIINQDFLVPGGGPSLLLDQGCREDRADSGERYRRDHRCARLHGRRTRDSLQPVRADPERRAGGIPDGAVVPLIATRLGRERERYDRVPAAQSADQSRPRSRLTRQCRPADRPYGSVLHRRPCRPGRGHRRIDANHSAAAERWHHLHTVPAQPEPRVLVTTRQ